MRFQVLNKRQQDWKKSDIPDVTGMVRLTELLRIGYGNREFSYLRFEYVDGNLRFYLNEWVGGQLESIRDDNLFDDLMLFCDNYHKGIKNEGSSL